MRQLIHLFKSTESLNEFILSNRLSKERGLIQIFSGLNESHTASIAKQIISMTPTFCVIGTSTYGEILAEKCYSNQLVIHFCIFEKDTQIEPFEINSSTTVSLADILTNPYRRSPQLAIIYANAFTINPEDVIRQFYHLVPDCKVVGGIAADDGHFQSAYMLLGDKVKTNGLIGVLLYGETLKTLITSFEGWRPIGRQFTVTQAHKNTVFKLDDRPIIEIYNDYIGEHITQLFPKSVTEFPLMLRNSKRNILRAPISLTKCGQGIIYAGTLKVGDKVSFSFADVTSTLKGTPEFFNQKGVCTLTFSCAARRSFLKGRISEEIERISKRTESSGGFFYGEFSTVRSRAELLNLSTTVLQLSESDVILEANRQSDPQRSLPNSTQALTNLATKASAEHEALLYSLRQHQNALDSSSIISITSASGVIYYVNKKFEQISGYSADELIGNTHRIIRHPKMKNRVFEQLWKTISKKKRWSGLLRNRRKDGSSYYVKTIIYPITDESGEIKEYVSIRNDVTDIVTARQTIQKQNTDALTHLPNRAKLSKDLERTPVESVAIFDIKNFKLLNDYWGISYGDAVIKLVAERFRSLSFNYSIKLYHLNGAVFAIRPIKPIKINPFKFLAMEIKETLESSDFVVDGHNHEINFSVGLGNSKKRALAYAESATIEAKHDSFSSSLIIRTEDSETDDFYFWLEETKLALKENRVIPYFQKVATMTSEDRGHRKYEALVRIRLRDGEIVSPNRFLNYLKKTRYYQALTHLMVDATVKQSIESNCFISVNLSIQDILDVKTVRYIINALESNPAAQVIFEITESEAIRDFASINSFIQQVRALGALIAIDDFGSGYSNFIYLVEIKPDYIKIDGSIIKSIQSNPNSKHVTRSIIDMAKSLNIKTIAEFVSDKQTFDILKQLGAGGAQGFYIARPCPDIEEGYS